MQYLKYLKNKYVISYILGVFAVASIGYFLLLSRMSHSAGIWEYSTAFFGFTHSVCIRIFSFMNCPLKLDWIKLTIAGYDMQLSSMNFTVLQVYWVFLGGFIGTCFCFVVSYLIFRKRLFRRNQSEFSEILKSELKFPLFSFLLLFLFIMGAWLMDILPRSQKALAKQASSDLLTAVLHNDIKQAEQILKENEFDNKSGLEYELCRACSNGNIAMIELLLAHGAVVNRAQAPSIPLIFARKHLAVIEFLIKNGANVNARDSSGYTVLMNYVLLEDIPEEITKKADILIKNGADINAINKIVTESTVLDMAIFNRCAPVVIDFLRKNGAKSAKELKQKP